MYRTMLCVWNKIITVPFCHECIYLKVYSILCTELFGFVLFFENFMCIVEYVDLIIKSMSNVSFEFPFFAIWTIIKVKPEHHAIAIVLGVDICAYIYVLLPIVCITSFAIKTFFTSLLIWIFLFVYSEYHSEGM